MGCSPNLIDEKEFSVLKTRIESTISGERKPSFSEENES